MVANTAAAVVPAQQEEPVTEYPLLHELCAEAIQLLRQQEGTTHLYLVVRGFRILLPELTHLLAQATRVRAAVERITVEVHPVQAETILTVAAVLPVLPDPQAARLTAAEAATPLVLQVLTIAGVLRVHQVALPVLTAAAVLPVPLHPSAEVLREVEVVLAEVLREVAEAVLPGVNKKDSNKRLNPII
jgi:hypothetical protein